MERDDKDSLDRRKERERVREGGGGGVRKTFKYGVGWGGRGEDV